VPAVRQASWGTVVIVVFVIGVALAIIAALELFMVNS
jgi:hypothetical protein